jgi:3-isopropylmalate dehydrogenase
LTKLEIKKEIRLTKTIAVLPGDGIGPEVTSEAIKVLKAVSDKFSLSQFNFKTGLIGGIAIDEAGHPLPKETIDLCKSSQAVLLGSVGGPKWDSTDPNAFRPEQGLLGIRKELNLFANLRPVKIFKPLVSASTLKPEVIKDVDLVVVRELTGGIYFGQRGRQADRAFDTCDYQKYEIKRLLKVAFDLASQRRKIVHSVDKANVLESSRLWRETAIEVGKERSDIKLEHMLVDNCAMQLVRQPSQFDVIAVGNMFGDILSDEASMLSGSLGMLASASLGENNSPGLYEPSHGSAPDIAGKNIANPIATILSAALMLRYSFKLEREAKAVEQAVETVLEEGYRTADIMETNCQQVSTSKMGDLVVGNLL